MTDKNIDKLLKDSLSRETDANETLKSEVLDKMQNTNKNPVKFTKILRNTAAVAACFVLCIGVAANVSSKAYNALKEIPIIGAITEAVTFSTYTDDSGKNIAYVEKPEIEGYEEVSKEIDTYIDQIIADYEAHRDMGGAVGETDRFNLTTGYAIVGETEELFSLKVWTNIVMAGTQEYNKFFVVNKATGKKIDFDDLFPTDAAKAGVKNILLDKMGEISAKGSVTYYTDSLVIDQNTKFYITSENELVICFDKYEAAPGAYGVQEFRIGMIKDGKAVLGESPADVMQKVEGKVIDGSMNTVVIEDFNGDVHSFYKENAVIIDHGSGMVIGSTVEVFYYETPNGIDVRRIEIY